jgi:MFS family permease
VGTTAVRGRRILQQARRWLRPEWWSRNLTVVLAARVSMSAGRALAGVITPIYLSLEGFSAVRLAEYVLTVAICSAGLSTFAGTVSDRIGRKSFLVVMPLLTAAAGATFAVSAYEPLLFVMGALGSFGRGAGAGAGAVGPYQPAESALVTDTLEARHRNDAFGRLAFGSSLGATAGGLLALLVPSSHVHGSAATTVFRAGFLAVAAVSAFAGLLALALVERPFRCAGAAGPPGSAPPAAAARGAEQPGSDPLAGAVPIGPGPRRRRLLPEKSRWLLYRLWLTNGLNGMAIGMFGPFVTYWFFRRFGASASEVGILFAAINAVTTASVLSAAGLARRLGLVKTVAIVRTMQAALLVPMVLSPTFALAGAVYFVRMVVQRIGLPLRQSYTLGLADPDERGSVAALSNLPSQVAMAGSPLLTGYLFEEVSLSLPFEIAAALQLANAGTFWAFFRHHPPDEERDQLEALPLSVQPAAATDVVDS